MNGNTLILVEQLSGDIVRIHGHFLEGTTPQDAALLLNTSIHRSNTAGEHHLKRRQGNLNPLFLVQLGGLITEPIPGLN